MIEIIQKHFLLPGSAQRLGVSRTLFYGLYLLQLWLLDPSPFSTLPVELWRPTLLLSFFSAPTPALFTSVDLLLKTALAFACIGFLSRYAAVAVALAGTYLFGVVNGYGYADFGVSPLILISWVLAVAPIGDAYSVDTWLRRKPLVRNPVDYYWPIRLAQIVLVALMFTAGLRKVLGSWVLDPAGSLESFLRYKYFVQVHEKVEALSAFTLVIADLNWLLFLSALFILFCEVGCPLAIPNGWPLLRTILIAGLFLMQLVLAVWLKTLPTFPWIPGYVFWVPWHLLMGKHIPNPGRS